jgi:KRAB domain-containing zinc finger protein
MKFKCHYCKGVFNSQESLSNHIANYHPKKFQCDLCVRDFSTKEQIKTHMKEHLRLFSISLPVYRRIVKNKIMMVKKIKCSMCDQMYSRKDRLRDHMCRVHFKKRFSCWQCSYQAGTEKDLRMHGRSHSEAYQRVISVLNDVKDKIFVRDNLF